MQVTNEKNKQKKLKQQTV